MNAIVITCVSLGIFLILLWISVRLFITLNLSFVQESKVQKSEIINKKFFITSTGYKLKYKFINPEQGVIVLCVSDLYGDINNFDDIIKKHPSLSFFVLGNRNSIEKFRYRTIACDFKDILDVTKLLREEFHNKKIILLLESYNCGWIFKLAKSFDYHKLLIVNPITNFKPIKLSWKLKLKLPFNFLFSWKHKIVFKFNHQKLYGANHLPSKEVLHTNRVPTELIVWLQYKILNKTILKKITKYNDNIKHAHKIIWYQASQSIFAEPVLVQLDSNLTKPSTFHLLLGFHHYRFNFTINP